MGGALEALAGDCTKVTLTASDIVLTTVGLKVGPRLAGIAPAGLTVVGNPPWGLKLAAAMVMGTNCTEAAFVGVAAVVNLMEVPDPGAPMGTELGVLIVSGKLVGGRMIVVAVARGMFPGKGAAFAGGLEVKTVTLLLTTA